jgi:hypothetical protein
MSAPRVEKESSVRRPTRWTLPLLALLVSALPARADEGRIELNQSRALAGGIAPGDTPGFPVLLDAAGSYVLTGDLTVPSNTTGIRITVSDVSLDLNGFAVRAGGGMAGFGIEIAGTYARVHGGTITGAGSDGVLVTGADARLEDLTVRSNAASGIRVGLGADRSVIRNSRVAENQLHGINFLLGHGHAIEGCHLTSNQGAGATLAAGGQARFERTVAHANQAVPQVSTNFHFVAPNYCGTVGATCP